jgi:uncharacterized membrane protein
MRTLFAVTYPTIIDARTARDKLKDMQEGATISLLDAVIVSRSKDGAVKLDQAFNMTAAGAASGALWGSLLGLLFLSPLIGAAIGAGAGALGGYTSDYGISDSFMKTMGEKLENDAATLFVLASDMTPDRVASALAISGAKVAYTSMPDDLERQFSEKFGVSNMMVEPELKNAVDSLDKS